MLTSETATVSPKVFERFESRTSDMGKHSLVEIGPEGASALVVKKASPSCR